MPRLGQLLRPRSRVSIVAATGLVLGILYLPALPASAESSNVALSVSLTQGEGNATAGMPWAYVITVSNAPDAGASNGYTVSLDIPDGTTVDQIDAGCTDAGNTVDCTSGALAPDSSDVFNVSLNVGSDFADGGALGTSANITDINGDTDLTTDDDQSSVQTTVDAVADLGIDKGGPDGSDPIVVAGDPAGYDYTLTVSNNGPSDTAFTVSDTLPDGLTFDSGDGCSATGQAVTCTGTIAAGADAKVFTVTVLADPSVPDASILENDATVAADNGTEDPNSENNTSGTVSTMITAQADLSPTLTILGGPFTAGGANFSGTVRVDNNGDSDNTGGFSVNVPLPTDVVFISGATGCSSVAGGFTCSTTSGLAAGAHKDFSITLRAKSNVPAATYPLTATVTSSGTVDPTPGNNASTPATDVAVITRADLSLTTAAITYPSSQTAAWANTNTAQNFAIYEYNVTNNGPSDAQSVSFADSLPTGVTIVGACFGTVSCSPNQTLPLSIGTLNGNDGSPANESTHVRVKVTADASLRGGPLSKIDSASVTSSTTDPGPSLNARAETATVWTVPSSPTNPDARPGNGNAFFLWKQVLASNGGSPIDKFQVTVTGTGAPSVPDVLVGDNCGTGGNQQIFCTGVSPLTNGNVYTFVARSHNAVGSSDPTTGVQATPSIDASAKQIGGTGGVLTQNTGNGTTSNTDKQVEVQTFPNGTTGVGTIIEGGNGLGTFCSGSCTLGNIVRTKLLDPHLQNAYTITLLFDKTLVGGTGQKYSFFYAASDTAPTGQVLAACPKTITTGSLPCVETKLGSGGANPALKAIIHTKDPDPTIGGRAYPK